MMASMLIGSSSPIASSGTAGSFVTKASRYKTQKIQNEYPIMRHHRQNLKHHHRPIEAACNCKKWVRRSYVVNASNGESFDSKAQDASPKSFWASNKYSLYTFYKFSRPYAMIAVAINLISVSILAVENLSDISVTFFIGLLKALVVFLPMKLYGNGLNQLADVEIDKINKPYLPLASGEYSFKTGVIIVASCAIMSFGLGWIVGSPPLFWAIFSHFILGTIYSINLPLLRWKRSTMLTTINFVIDRGFFQIAFFLHMQAFVFKRSIMFPRSLIFMVIFTTLSTIFIALYKDIPDIEGDKKFGIQSLSTRLGQKQVFWICVSLLEMTFGVGIVVGATSSYLWSKIITTFGHALLASILWYRAKSVDLKSKADTQSFYLFTWKVLNMEHIIIPFLR